MKKRIAILGSTGSIGTQALEVVEEFPDRFEVEVLTANNNADLLISQAIKYVPNTVVIGDKSRYDSVSGALSSYPVKVFAGHDAACQVVEMDSVDIVLTAIVGYKGLLPTINAIKAGKNIALANKETLVIAGELVTKMIAENNVSIYPVDSEHSAIFQCLAGEQNNAIEKIILTASGGPFRTKDISYLQNVTREEALDHPNWDMGDKITIDSASMMNKGLEVIEAKWLFDVKPDQIQVIIHPQSVIHSIVQFNDGSMKAQMGIPDMKLPIQYALSYPERYKSGFRRFNFADYPNLSFEEPDLKKFRNLALSFQALLKGGNMPCIMNAANEVAVEEFLAGNISFLQMPDIIEETMIKAKYISNPVYSDYVSTDTEARMLANEIMKK